MSAAKITAQNLINENGVVVFSKSYCPYCKASKDLLNELGAKYTTLELDEERELPLSVRLCLRLRSFHAFHFQLSQATYLHIASWNRSQLAPITPLCRHSTLPSRHKTPCPYLYTSIQSTITNMIFFNRGRRRYPKRSPGNLRPAHCSQHLHQPEAHWR